MDKKKRMEKILSELGQLYPDRGTALKFDNRFQLLVAVILSAQCTDERVNKVTKELFKDYKDAGDFDKIPVKDLEKKIFSTGFYRAKAKSIKGTAKMVCEKFNGDVPGEMESLLLLPGVARKTANVVLGAGFGKVEGIVVDTHVKRLSSRLGFTENKNPEKIEKDLMLITPKNEWWNLSNYLIWHGRRVCDAKKPNCNECVLNGFCPSAFSFSK